MYDYIKGTVVELKYNSIVVDNNGIGYLIYVPNPYAFEVSKDYKVFVYQQVKEDEEALFGFKTREEKELFLKLIGVSGIGPKSALAILAAEDHVGLIQAIEEENVKYLQKFPGVGKKTASQIVLDLQGKLADLSPEVIEVFGDGKADAGTRNIALEEALEALSVLGYTQRDIKKVTPKLEELTEGSADDYIREALKHLIH